MSGPGGAADLVRLLTARGETLAVAESLTGGAVLDAVVGVPGASACLRGGVVAYARDVKASVLGVPVELLERCGAVHPDVAEAMAAGARRVLGADHGLATTGVAGPEPQDGVAPGTAYVALRTPLGHWVERVDCPPGTDRAGVRAAAVEAALCLAVRRTGDLPHGPDRAVGTGQDRRALDDA